MKTRLKTIIIFLLISSIALFVQKAQAQVTAGVGLAYGSKISTVGINVTAQFYITENIAVAPAFTYYFPSTTGIILGYKRKWYEANIDANYYPDIEILKGKLKTYGLVGANYAVISYPDYTYWTYTTSSDYTSSNFGVNIGAGADFDMGKKITPFAQLKYTIGFDSYSQAQIVAGIRFKF